MGKLGTDRNGGSNHALFSRGIRGRQTRKPGRPTPCKSEMVPGRQRMDPVPVAT